MKIEINKYKYKDYKNSLEITQLANEINQLVENKIDIESLRKKNVEKTKTTN